MNNGKSSTMSPRAATSKTTVVNLRRERYDVYIGRAGHGQDGTFGNPFSLPKGSGDELRDIVLRRFRAYFLERVEVDPEFRRKVLALRGKRLGCFCAPRRCHGDVISAWVDAQAHSTCVEKANADRQWRLF